MNIKHILTSIMFVFILPLRGFSCDCPIPVEPGSMAKTNWGLASVVVTASVSQVTDIDRRESEVYEIGKGKYVKTFYDTQITDFQTIRVWKGIVGKKLKTKINIRCCNCGFTFTEKDEYILYLSGPDKEGYYKANSCSGTKLLQSAAEEEIEYLNNNGHTRP